MHGTAAEAAALSQRALGDDARIFTEQAEPGAPGDAVMVLALAERQEAAARAARQAMTFARRRGALHELAGAWWLSAYAALLRGDLTAAEADARQCVDIARLGGLVTAELVLTPGLVAILVTRGDVDAATTELARTGMVEGPIPDNPWLMTLSLARGTLRYAQGRTREAAEDLVELHERKQRWGIGGNVMIQAGAYGALALAACGEHDQARLLAEADLANARRWGSPTPQCLALCSLAVATGGAEGLGLLQEATRQGATASTQAFALVELGAALRRTNQRAEAREPLREGLELARRCGAAATARRAYDELTATGEKVRRWTPIGVESLTPSERRVAEMAANGMTNRQIAQSLFLTVKTIEAHLAATYDKLGIRSRQQLPEVLAAPT